MTMDRIISPEERRKRQRTRYLKMAVGAAAGVAVFVLLVRLLSPKIDLNTVNVGTVDRGALEVSVYATGKVVPLAEEVITSPVSSKILEVYKKAGDRVRKDEPILQLDLETIRTEYETKKEALDMQWSKLDLQRSTIENTLAEMRMQIDIDRMMLERARVAAANERYLDSIGASTSEKVKQAELDYTIKKMQFEQLDRKYENQQRTSKSEIRSLELDYKIAKRNTDLLHKKLGEAQILAPRDATLIYINDQIGASVGEGTEVAILADLSSFKVEAEVADSYADKILSGNRVTVKIGREKLGGTVGNVTPSVKNGLIKFTVALDDRSHGKLRSGLKVDVYVTYSLKEDVARLNMGTFYAGKGEYDLWVVEGDEVRKRRVVLGENSFEYVEVVGGLKEGERVIVSDMNRNRLASLVRLRASGS